MKFPVTPLGVALVAYPAYLMYTDWHSVWYDYHPAFMMAGFLALSGNSFAAELKKLHYLHAGMQVRSARNMLTLCGFRGYRLSRPSTL